MNFELADELTKLLSAQELGKAIQLAESELKKIPGTDFHKILGRDLKKLAPDLRAYITAFDRTTTNVLKKKQGFLKSLFGKKDNLKPAAFYCEMNGFTINNDRWYIDLFSYEKFGTEDWDWIADFYDSTENGMTIVGLEDLQRAFQDVHDNDRLEEPVVKKAYEVAELLVILRLQELFRETYRDSSPEWATIPMFVTAHDYEMICRVN